MTEENVTTDQAGDAGDELVTPPEHAEATEDVDPGVDVADPSVPDDVEIAGRSADMEDPSTAHTKVFVVGPGIPGVKGNPWTEANGYDHEPNKAATRQYAISHGMWPTGDVSFKSAKKHPDGVSWVLTYTVPVIPAHTGADGAQAPSVVAADGDTDGARDYEPPAETVDDGEEPTE